MAKEASSQDTDELGEVKLKYEYRVEFRNPYPQNVYVHYSAAYDDVDKLPRYAPRSEETHDYVAGIQIRTVTEWSETFLLDDLEEEEADGSTTEAPPGRSASEDGEREGVVGWRGYREDGNGSRLLLD